MVTLNDFIRTLKSKNHIVKTKLEKPGVESIKL